MTIQAKTTLLFTLLTLTVFLVLTATVYYFSNQFAYSDFYKRLELRARIAARFNFENDHTTASFKELQRQYLERLADEKTRIVSVDSLGRPLQPLQEKLPLSYLRRILNAGGETVYYNDNLVHYAGVLYRANNGYYLVIESATNRYGAEIITRLRNILIVTLIASIIIILTVGRYFSRSTFKPIREITKRVQEISEGNLQLRLEGPTGNDEIAKLVQIFNQMLDRLETAFETQNNFVSNASHELRTPLTAIVAEADYALNKQRTAEVYQQSLQQIMHQAEKLQHLTRGLLSLAQTGFDTSKHKQLWEKINALELLTDVRENVCQIFPDSTITITQQPTPPGKELALYGNEVLLKIAIGNIMLNACKYSNHAPVLAELLVREKKLIIKITDQGIGIPEEEIQKIKNPFFRASNTTGFEGYGIGLPLSNNIIRLHKGNIAVSSKVREGTEVVLILPLYDATQATVPRQ